MDHILFFIKEITPTADELALAAKIDGDVTFRCIKYVDTVNLEPADAVAGLVPGVYASAQTGDSRPLYPAATLLAPPAPVAPPAPSGAAGEASA